MNIQIKDRETFHAVYAALSQYVENMDCGIENTDPDDVSDEDRVSLEKARVVLDQFDAALIASAA